MERRCTCHMPTWVKNPMYHASDCQLIDAHQGKSSIANPSGETIQSATGERSEAVSVTGEPPVDAASPLQVAILIEKLRGHATFAEGETVSVPVASIQAAADALEALNTRVEPSSIFTEEFFDSFEA